MRDFTVKWTDKGKPVVYELRGARRIQLTKQQVMELSRAGIFHDGQVMAWLKAAKEAKEQPVDTEAVPNVENGTLKPNSRELYEYLESLYGKVRTMGGGQALYQNSSSVGKGTLNFNF